MRVFILSLLAVSSVHSHAIRYPYHGQLLSYTPARGEFPVYNDLAQGYVRYFDSNGAERLVGYNYPEPLYGVRRYNFAYGGNQGNQLLRTYGAPESGFSAESYYQIQDTNELAKAREEHFRRWCEQRYQALKSEMNKLRAEGLKPSSDMMAQLKPLEKIISSSTYAAIGESPEIQRIRDEHLRIWNEARLKVLQQEADHLRFSQSFKQTTQIGTGQLNGADQNAIIGETAEQKQAREEHLRIYNEQLAKLKQIEAEQMLQQGNLDVRIMKEAQAIPTLAVKSGIQQIPSQQQLATPIAEPAEVIKAREEHLRIYNEQLAKLKQLEADKSRFYIGGNQQTTIVGGEYNTKLDAVIGETAEQKKAREEHLRLYNEQLAKVKQLEAEQKLQSSWGSTSIKAAQTYGTYQEVPSFELKASFQQSNPIGDTPEVIKAREEHLRLVNEAKLRAQTEGTYNTNDDGSYKAEYQTGSSYNMATANVQQAPILRIIPAVQQPIQPIQNIAILQTSQPTNQGIQQQQSSVLKTSMAEPQQPTPVQDTPEVIRAREEHLRLVNEAKLKATAAQQHIKEIDASAALIQQTDKAQIYSATIDDAEKLREEERLREEQRLMEAERLREADRLREEEKMREMERLREIERQKEEEKMLQLESMRLKEEEAKRIEMERLDEEKRLKEEQEKRISLEQGGGISSDLLGSQLKAQQALGLTTQQSSIYTSGSSSAGLISSTGTATKTSTGTGTGTGFVLSSQYKNNPFLIRFASQPGTTAYIIGDQQQAAIKTDASLPNLYYLPAQKENPLNLRYTQSALKSPNAVQQLSTATLTGGSAEKVSTYSSSSSSSSSGSSSSSNLKVSYGASTDTTSGQLSELEKATRDHFRAHELALEQLRLANAKTPYTKDC